MNQFKRPCPFPKRTPKRPRFGNPNKRKQQSVTFVGPKRVTKELCVDFIQPQKKSPKLISPPLSSQFKSKSSFSPLSLSVTKSQFSQYFKSPPSQRKFPKRISKEGFVENSRKRYTKRFQKQSDCVEWVTEQNEQEKYHVNRQWKVFAREVTDKGQRCFIAIRYYGYFHYILPSRKQSERTYYEVIQDGSPCQLYFDVEYPTQYNQKHDGDAAINIFKKFVIRKLRESKEINDPNIEPIIIDLEATHSKKFSRHLIVRIPGKSFKDGTHAGVFVERMYEELQDEMKTNLELSTMFIHTSDPSLGEPKSWFVDRGVYTKNRCFRIVNNVKFKYRHQEVNGENLFVLRHKFALRKLSDDPGENEYFNWQQTLICFLDENQINGDIIEMPMPEKKLKERKNVQSQSQGVSGKGSSSCLPMLDRFMDDFIENQWPKVAPWGNCGQQAPKDVKLNDPLTKRVPGKICNWRYEKLQNGKYIFRYTVDTNNFCMFIKRRHRNNHIFFEVHWDKPTCEKGCDPNNKCMFLVQRCWDPDCRGMKSLPYYIEHSPSWWQPKHNTPKPKASSFCTRSFCLKSQGVPITIPSRSGMISPQKQRIGSPLSFPFSSQNKDDNYRRVQPNHIISSKKNLLDDNVFETSSPKLVPLDEVNDLQTHALKQKHSICRTSPENVDSIDPFIIEADENMTSPTDTKLSQEFDEQCSLEQSQDTCDRVELSLISDSLPETQIQDEEVITEKIERKKRQSDDFAKIRKRKRRKRKKKKQTSEPDYKDAIPSLKVQQNLQPLPELSDGEENYHFCPKCNKVIFESMQTHNDFHVAKELRKAEKRRNLKDYYFTKSGKPKR